MIRTSVILDEKIEVKIRKYQANKMLKTGKGYSFSDAMNDILREYFK